MKDEFVCCLCGKKVSGSWGNNPWPLDNRVDARCCDECNYFRVVPARITRMCQGAKKVTITEENSKAGD